MFVCLCAGFFAAAFAVPPILIHFSSLLPENYQHNAEQAMRRDDFARAAAIARSRISQHFYDFDAHYLLAEALARNTDYAGAARVMKDVIAKIPAARANKVSAVGYDEARTLLLLSQYLWEAGSYIEAGEMACAALDAGAALARKEMGSRLKKIPDQPDAACGAARVALKLGQAEPFQRAVGVLARSSGSWRAQGFVYQSLWLESKDNDTSSAEEVLNSAIREYPQNCALHLALSNLLQRHGRGGEAWAAAEQAFSTTGTKAIGSGLFRVTPGATVTTAAVSLARNGIASSQVTTGVYRLTNLALCASGTSALGVCPLVTVKAGENELMRLYVDGLQPHLYDLPLWPSGVPKTLDLQLEFINDIYDPFTKADRNVSFSNVVLY